MPETETRAARLARGTAIAALAPLPFAPLWLPYLPADGFWLARGLALTGAVAAALACSRSRRPALASPAFTLPLLAFFFYSLLPALHADLLVGGPIPIPPTAHAEGLRALLPSLTFITGYTASSAAEALVLSFAGSGLLIALTFDHLIPPRSSKAEGPETPIAWPLAMIGGAGALFQSARRALGDGPPSQWLSLIDTLPPVVTLGMAWLVLGCILERNGRWRAWTAAGLAAGGVLLFPYHIKACAFLAGTFLLIWILTAKGWARMAGVLVLAVLPLLAAVAVQAPRGMGGYGIGQTIVAKTVLRQAETMFCLEFALREAAAGGGEWRTGPFYFVVGLVPRAIWPEKPSLSHGGAYGMPFCGTSGPQHSASITLLGEPLLRGGPVGLAVAGTVLAGLSVLVLAAWKQGRFMTAAVALGLTPWLIDFDQHFAMYVANAAKALLAMLAAGTAVSFLHRRFRKTSS